MTKNSSYNGLISVVISTYNWPEALYLVLLSFQHQIDKNFEVIIVDDGSTIETKNTIDQFSKVAHFPITHLWQEDKGFRLSRARNMGIQSAKGDYLIFIDGDCIIRPSFIQNHRALAEKGYYVAGNRVLLSQTFSMYILKNHIDISSKSLFSFLFYRCKGYINRFHSLLLLSTQSSRRYAKKTNWQKGKGCNMAFWRKDLIQVYGFEETFEGWGYEDSDIMIRLINHGTMRKSGYFSTAILHLWHHEASKSLEKENYQRLEDTLKKEETKPKVSSLMQ